MRLDHEVVIVGTGFSGLGAAIKLKQMGIDFVVLEKADDIGGTWRDNDYPGLHVDMPSWIYSYPFEMSAEWSRVYPAGREIKAYADHCTDKYGVRPHIRFGKTVLRTEYDEAENVWRTHLDGGEVISSRYFVSASGLLIEPRLPDIQGIDEFQGKLIHSARWDHDYDLDDKRVAVIGTGATAVQLLPAIVDQVRHLDVYQRTPIWLMSKPDGEVSDKVKRLFRRVPLLQHAIRFLINAVVEVTMGMGFIRYRRFPWMFNWLEKKLVEQIRAQVDDPEIQEKLIPDYSFFCKRPSFSNVFYPVFNREHVELVTDPIERITEKGVLTREGSLREVDALICATGYEVFDRRSMPTFEVVGRGGKNLGDYWEKNRFQAYLGATVPGFPNYFLVMGPYSASGASYFGMIDTQVHHLARCLREAQKRGANCVEVRQEAHDRDFQKVLRRREDTVMFGGNCSTSNSYYFDSRGDTPSLRPVSGLEHWLESRLFQMANYEFKSI
jgi:cation diffusion facilitator CzcD-associated flavoprotein CzcO